MDEQGEYAVLSKAAYDYFYNHELAKEELKAYNLPYTFDEEHSDSNSVTIVRPDGSVIISYRGTVPSNPSDIISFDFRLNFFFNTLQKTCLESKCYFTIINTIKH